MKTRECFLNYISPIIRQKGKSHNEGKKETKNAKFPEKKNFLSSDTHTCVYISKG